MSSKSFKTSFINKIVNAGIKKEYNHWELFLTRKINTITLVAMLNMLLGISFFLIIDFHNLILDCLLAFLLAPLVLLMNKIKNYIWASYVFYLIGFLFFISINLKMGKDSYMLLFYFPMIISLVQMLGRKETIKHLIGICILCVASIIIIAAGFINKWVIINIEPAVLNKIMIFNIILSVITAISFIIVITVESISQERLIKKMLTEKDILLSEIFHRVKNNMNIVTSLLSLKKNMSDSIEVKNALDECKNRVYSMALVHQKIFEKGNVNNLNFKDYIQNLTKELLNSIGKDNSTELNIKADDIFIELSNAIPCGLIINEFVTNSYKYAQTENKNLEISILLNKINETIELKLKDNGPGLSNEAIGKPNTLGIELIKSLSEQINGTYSFKNENGLVFSLQFKQDNLS